MKRVVIFMVLAVASCSEAVDTKPPAAPSNRCNSSAECASYPGASCNPRTLTCVVPPQADLAVTYVISFAAASSTLPGLTVALPRAQLASCRGAVQSCAATGACACITIDILRSVLPYESDYRLSAATARQFDDYKFGGIQTSATIPVRAAFRPLTPFGNGTELASAVGVPGLPVVGVPGLRLRPGTPLGPQRSPASWFAVSLFGGRYLRSLEPLAPFDELFPPVVNVIDVSPDEAGIDVAGVDLDKLNKRDHAFRLEVQLNEPLTGWIGYLRDAATGFRISTTFRPKPGVNDVVLRHYASQPAELVIEPPFGSPRPSLVSPHFPAVTAETLPALPPPIRVSGGVFGGPDDVDVRATLIFRNATDRDVSLLEPRNSKLSYTTDVQTAADGTYAVDLPPGEYTVAVVPAYESDYGVAVAAKFVVPSSSLNRELAGRGLSAPRLQIVEGTVTLPAGAPFAGAKVVLKPRALDSDDLAYPLARLRSTVTGADGTFRVGVDPGIYDVIVEPPVELHWPRVIVSSLAPGAPIEVPSSKFSNVVDVVRVPPIALAAPIDLGFNLLDLGARRPVSGAIVRAFTTIAGRNTAVELATGTTDAAGRVDLYAVPPR